MNGYKFCPNYRVSCPNIYLLNPCPQIQKAYPRFQNWIYFIDNNNICVCLYKECKSLAPGSIHSVLPLLDPFLSVSTRIHTSDL